MLISEFYVTVCAFKGSTDYNFVSASIYYRGTIYHVDFATTKGIDVSVTSELS